MRWRPMIPPTAGYQIQAISSRAHPSVANGSDRLVSVNASSVRPTAAAPVGDGIVRACTRMTALNADCGDDQRDGPDHEAADDPDDASAPRRRPVLRVGCQGPGPG